LSCLLSSTQGTFTWNFGDGSPNLVTTNFSDVTHTYLSNKNGFIVTLTYNNVGCSVCNSKSYSLAVSKACNSDFNTLVTNGCVVTVDASKVNSTASYSWDFGDCGKATGSNAVHTFNPSGVKDYTIKLTVKQADGTECSSTKTISVGCGSVYARRNATQDRLINGVNFRLASEIFCQNNLFFNNFGAYAKSFRKYYGIWIQSPATILTVSIAGDYYERTTSVDNKTICTLVDLPFLAENETNSSYVARNIFVKNASFLDNHLNSNQTMRIGAITWSTPQLFLTN
jgi:hypothetical protein